MQIAAAYPQADTIHLVMDNLSSHSRKALVDRFGEKIGALLRDRFTVHYTPKHGSWLNQAEIEISLYSRQCLANPVPQNGGFHGCLESQAPAPIVRSVWLRVHFSEGMANFDASMTLRWERIPIVGRMHASVAGIDLCAV